MRDYKKWSAQERTRSYNMTRQAKKLGLIPNPTRCCFCGQDRGILHYHNTDYDVTLELQPKLLNGTATDEDKARIMDALKPVCWTCHMMLHRGEKHPKSAEAYFASVKAGARYKPIFRGNAWEELDKFMID